MPLSALTCWHGQVEQLSLRHRDLAMPVGGPARTDVGVLSAAGPFTIRYQAAAPGHRAGEKGPSNRSSPAVPASVFVEGARLQLQGAHVDIDRLQWADGRLDAALRGGGLPVYWVTRFAPIEALYLEDFATITNLIAAP